jgi:hypothetical protein
MARSPHPALWQVGSYNEQGYSSRLSYGKHPRRWIEVIFPVT